MISFKNFIKDTKEALAVKPFYSSLVSSCEQQAQYRRLMRFIFVSAGVALVSIEPSLANAAGTVTADAGNLQTALDSILNALTGALGKTIATLAVVVLGVMAMFGKLAWDTAIKVIVGVALVFGAASVVKWVGGSMNAGTTGL